MLHTPETVVTISCATSFLMVSSSTMKSDGVIVPRELQPVSSFCTDAMVQLIPANDT